MEKLTLKMKCVQVWKDKARFEGRNEKQQTGMLDIAVTPEQASGLVEGNEYEITLEDVVAKVDKNQEQDETIK